jgi:large subunit ribosomal protein L1
VIGDPEIDSRLRGNDNFKHMGKIRAKTLGDAEQEQKERDEAEKRRLAKIEAAKEEGQARSQSSGQAKKAAKEAEEAAETEKEPVIASEAKQSQEIETKQTPRDDKSIQEEAPKEKKKIQKKGKAHERSAKYKEAASLIEKGKTYSLSQGLELLEKTHLAKFDETVELHINTIESTSGSMTLPHGTGKATRVAILAPSKDAAAADALLKQIEAGKITFDVLIATPDAMPRLAKVARVLGPKGLMPNPKSGTVTPNPEAVAKQYEGGHMTFKTEAKSPVLHLVVGKMSFGKEKLSENITTALKAVKTSNMRKVVLKSTMSPAVKLAVK